MNLSVRVAMLPLALALSLMARSSPAQTVVGTVPQAAESVAVYEAENRIILGDCTDNRIHFYDGASQTLLASWEAPGCPRAMTVNEDTGKAYISAGGTIAVLDAHDGAFLTYLGSVGGWNGNVSFQQDRGLGKVYVGALGGNGLFQVDVATDALTFITGLGSYSEFGVNPVTHEIFMATYAAPLMRVWDGVSLALVATVAQDGWGTGMAVDWIHNKVYGAWPTWSVYDRSAGTVERLLYDNDATSLLFNPTDQRVYSSADVEAVARVIDCADDSLYRSVPFPMASVLGGVALGSGHVYYTHAPESPITNPFLGNGIVYVFDAPSGYLRPIRTGANGDAGALAINQTTGLVYVAGNPVTVIQDTDVLEPPVYITSHAQGLGISVVDPHSHSVIETLSPPPFSSGGAVAFGPGQARGYVPAEEGDGGCTVEFMGLGHFASGSCWDAGGSNPRAAVVSRDGAAVFTSNSGSDNVGVRNLLDVFAPVQTIPVGDSPLGLALTPDGSRLLVTNQGSGTLSVIDTATLTVSSTIAIGQEPWGVAVNPSGTKVFVSDSASGQVAVLDLATGVILATVEVGTAPHGLAVSPDGKTLYVANSGSGTLSIVDATNYAVLQTVEGLLQPEAVACLPDGSEVYIAEYRFSSSSDLSSFVRLDTGSYATERHVLPEGEFWTNGVAAPTLTGTIAGRVSEARTVVRALQEGSEVTQATADDNGDYSLFHLAPGSYDVEFLEQSGPRLVEDVVAETGRTTLLSSASGLASLTVLKPGNGTGLVTSSPAGIDCGATCRATFSSGSTVTLTAAATGESSFAGWSGAGCSGRGTCTVTLDRAKHVTAMFVIPVLTVGKSGTGSGAVGSSPAGIDCGSECTATFSMDAEVTLTATPDPDSLFAGWGPPCSGTETCLVTMDRPRSVTASFALPVLTVVKPGTGTGIVTSSPAGIDCGDDCSEDYPRGTVVVLTATADAASAFTGWSGACSGTGTCSVTLDAVKSVTATFAIPVLSVYRLGTRTGRVTSAPAGIDCGEDCTETYAPGTLVTLTPTPDDGSVFSGWSGACLGSGGCIVTMNAAKSVRATFEYGGPFPCESLDNCGLTFQTTGDALWTDQTGVKYYGASAAQSGAVAASKASSLSTTVNGPGTLTFYWRVSSARYWDYLELFVDDVYQGPALSGEVDWVQRSVSIPIGAHKVRWTFSRDAGFSGGSDAGWVDKVEFTVASYALTVVRAGVGSGRVASTPGGIECGLDCSETYTHGTEVTLTATADPGSRFAGWAGACSGTDPCTLTLEGATSVTASFDAPAVAVSKAGTGTGRVTSSPAGVDCGSDCSEAYDWGAQVTLTAVADAGSIFMGWSGACSGRGACELTLNTGRAVTATFALPVSLTVYKFGAGTGAVTSNPTGINCGTDCTEPYEPGTQVALTAAVSTGSRFSGWGGACSGVGACVVTMNAARWVTATFDLGGAFPCASVDNCNLSFETFGEAPWLDQTAVRYSGASAAQSGHIGTSQTTSLSTVVAGPGTLNFHWKVSSLNYWDHLRFYVDGAVNGAELTGEVDWTERIVSIPSGAHTLRWTYSKDVNMSVGLDAGWVDQIEYTGAGQLLTVEQTGAGSGSVTSTLPGIDCGPDCAEEYVGGTVVTLTASPAPGSTFTGWSGAGCSGTETCVVTMDAPTTVTALFASCSFVIDPSAAQYDAAGGVGSVSVTASDGGCAWLAEASRSWITLTSGTPGTGNGSVAYSVDPNGGPARTGTIAVAGQPFTVNQGAAPTLSIGDATAVIEPDSGTVEVHFTVALAGTTSTIVLVGFAASNGTAVAGSDYVAISGVLTFAPGEFSRTVTVLVNGDTTVEPNETFFVNLSSAVGAAIIDGQALATIQNDDPRPRLQFSAANYAVNEAGTSATITVTRNGNTSLEVTVGYAASAGSAAPGDDFGAVSGTLSFAPSQTARTFTVPIVNDTTNEAAETVQLALSSPAGGAVLGAVKDAILTISDNDPAGSVQFSAAAYSVSEQGPVATITVTRTAGTASGVTVDYATGGGTATVGDDYAATAGTLSFGAGQTAATFTVPIVDDLIGENNETVGLTLSSPTGGATLGAVKGATLTIVENERVVQLAAAKVAVAESAPVATLTVRRSGLLAGSAVVGYVTSEGTAKAGVDYQSQAGALTFGPNVVSKTFTIPIVNDNLDETDETILVRLRDTVGCVVGAVDSAVVSITDNDTAGVVQFGAAAYSVSENKASATLTVTRSGGVAGGVSVAYSTSNGSPNGAEAGLDYTATGGVLTFAASQTSMTITVPVANDLVPEGAEAVTVTLSSPGGGATLGLRSAVVLTILDDESTIELALPAFAVTEGLVAQIPVKRSGSPSGTVTVSYATSDGTAAAGSEYVAKSGTLTFGPNVLTRTIPVPTLNDTANEPPETFAVTLTGPTGSASLGQQSSATVTINDNDAAGVAQFAAAAATVSEATASVTVTVRRTGGTASGVVVGYDVSGGTAQEGPDFGLTEGALTFIAGQTSRAFTVPIVSDTEAEDAETIVLALTPLAGGASVGIPGSMTITIQDNDAPQLAFSAANYTVSEAATRATITVKRIGALTSAATVQYATSDGEATAGEDYAATSGSLSFGAGAATRTFTIDLLGDALDEPNETINLTLGTASATHRLGAPSTAVLTITDNDVAGTVQLGAVAFSEVEGEDGTSSLATITVTRTGGTSQGATVDYATADGTATAGSDYTASAGTLTFGAGETAKTFTVEVLGDAEDEGNESATVALSSPGNGFALGAVRTAQLWIVEPAGAAKLVFVGQSADATWLADAGGGLGRALRDNNYFVSDTSAGWGPAYEGGPDSLGDHTDIGEWWSWFLGDSSETYLAALYAEDVQRAAYSRLDDPEPRRENEVVVFKAGFLNSNLAGNPEDPPTTDPNPLRGQAATDETGTSPNPLLTVGNAKGIYNDLLTYFAAHPEKLFVVVSAPPLVSGQTSAEAAANARALNHWLVNDWLADYAEHNVAVFDLFNVLSTNGGTSAVNDLGKETGNHHRWWNGAVQHKHDVASSVSAYATSATDSRPNATGGKKAAGELVTLLNYYYNSWRGVPVVAGVRAGSLSGKVHRTPGADPIAPPGSRQ